MDNVTEVLGDGIQVDECVDFHVPDNFVQKLWVVEEGVEDVVGTWRGRWRAIRDRGWFTISWGNV